MTAIRIRPAHAADAPTIVEYNRRLAWETEQKALDLAVLHRGVARLFVDDAAGFYRLAEMDSEIVGQLMVTFEWSDWRDGWFWWIQSVYVREGERRRGVFRALFDAIVNEAKQAGNVVGLRLYVERENSRAQRTYEELGMADAGYFVREVLIEQSPRDP